MNRLRNPRVEEGSSRSASGRSGVSRALARGSGERTRDSPARGAPLRRSSKRARAPAVVLPSCCDSSFQLLECRRGPHLASSCPELGDFRGGQLLIEENAVISRKGHSPGSRKIPCLPGFCLPTGKRSHSAVACGRKARVRLRAQLSRWRAKTKRLKLRIEPQT